MENPTSKEIVLKVDRNGSTLSKTFADIPLTVTDITSPQTAKNEFADDYIPIIDGATFKQLDYKEVGTIKA